MNEDVWAKEMAQKENGADVSCGNTTIDIYNIPLWTKYGTVCMFVSKEYITLDNHIDWIPHTTTKKNIEYNGKEIEFRLPYCLRKGRYELMNSWKLDMRYKKQGIFQIGLKEEEKQYIAEFLTATLNSWASQNKRTINECEKISINKAIKEEEADILNAQNAIKCAKNNIKELNAKLKKYEEKV